MAANPPSKEEVEGQVVAAAAGATISSAEQHDSPAAPDPEARPAAFKTTFSEIVYIATCTLATASVSLLAGTNQVITNKIGEDLHLTQAEISWIVAASSLTCGSFMLLFGRLADLFGRKTLFVGSMFLFAVLALAAGFCTDGIALDTVNGLMGLAGAAVVPPATGSLGVTYPQPGRRKNYAFACFSAGNPLGFAFGTIGSGVAAVIFDWRASYWLLAIIYLIVTVMGFFTVPADTAPKLPLNRDTLRRFDVVGAALGIAGVALFTSALTLGGSAPQGWRTPYVIAMLVVGAVVIAAFVLYESRYPFPIMPLWIWRDRSFAVLNAVVAIGMSGFSAALFWVALYIQRTWTSSPIHVAAYMLPCAVNGTIANVVVAGIMHRFSNKLIFTVATCIYAVAFLLLAVNKGEFGYWPLVFPALMLVVWGADMQFCIANMYVIATMPLEQQSLAGGIFQSVSRLGSTVGSGVTTAIFNAVEADPPRAGYYAGDSWAPYASALWYAFGSTVFAVALCAMLRITTQGHKDDRRRDSRASSQADERKGSHKEVEAV